MISQLGRILFFIIFCFFTICKSIAQTTADIDFANNLPTNTIEHNVVLEPAGKVSSVLYLPYWFYKKYISSQSGYQCSFYPSCANYGLETVGEYGIIEGVIITFDRLTRCSAANQYNYDWHLETDKLYDPIPTLQP